MHNSNNNNQSNHSTHPKVMQNYTKIQEKTFPNENKTQIGLCKIIMKQTGKKETVPKLQGVAIF